MKKSIILILILTMCSSGSEQAQTQIPEDTETTSQTEDTETTSQTEDTETTSQTEDIGEVINHMSLVDYSAKLYFAGDIPTEVHGGVEYAFSIIQEKLGKYPVEVYFVGTDENEKDKLGIPHPFGKIQNKRLLEFGGIPVWRASSTGVTQQVIDQLQSVDKFILYLTVEGEMKTNQTIKSGFHYIGKALDATVVPTKIDYKNRRFELMEVLDLTDSVEADKEALMDRYHLVQGKNKTFFKPGSK